MPESKGNLVALLTPFDRAGRIDEAALRGHIDGLIGAGVHGVVPGGSTGEVMSLDPDECHHLIATTVEHVAGRVPVVAGCSANATRQVILTYSEVSGHGIQAVKASMALAGRPLGEQRAPLRALSSEVLAEVERILARALRAPLPTR